MNAEMVNAKQIERHQLSLVSENTYIFSTSKGKLVIIPQSELLSLDNFSKRTPKEGYLGIARFQFSDSKIPDSIFYTDYIQIIVKP